VALDAHAHLSAPGRLGGGHPIVAVLDDP